MAGGFGGTAYRAPSSPERVGWGGPSIARGTNPRGVPQAGDYRPNARGGSGGLAWRPWTPPPIPSGLYNPIRGIELEAGKRGMENTLQDVKTGEAQGLANFNLGLEGIQGGLAHTEAEDRAARDTDVAKNREALEALGRRYKNLASTQEQNANQAGVLQGGAMLQAAAKRAANEGIERNAQNAALRRAEEGIERNLSNAREQASLAEHGEGLKRQEEQQGLETKGTRAEREQNQFGLDTRMLEGAEASQRGYMAPGAPFREYTGGPEGRYRVERRGGQYLSVTPRGHIFQRRPVRG